MFRKLAVCTVVLVAVLSNDALALHQGNSFTMITGGSQMEGLYTANTKTPMPTSPTATTQASPATPAVVTPAHEETTPTSRATPSPTTTPTTQPLVTPSTKTPTVEKGSHVSDCNPNFPSEKSEESLKATHAVTPMTLDVKSTISTPAVVTPTAKSTDHSAYSKTVSGNNEQTSQQANTKSGNQSGETSTGTGAFAVVGLIAAVAAVGVAVSQVKKARDADADAALVTPGENENIHIEIKSTPAGGSTIL